MNKITEFLSKWAFAIFLCVIAILLLFAAGCCIYTAVINPFVGIVGTIGVIFALGIVASWLWVEINEG